MLFQTDTSFTDEQIVGELFKNFVDTEDPAFLSSPDSDYGFITPPPPTYNDADIRNQQEIDYGVVPLSTNTTNTTNTTHAPMELYPRLSKKPRGSAIDIERWTHYRPNIRQYFSLYDGSQQEIGSTIDVHTKIDKVDQREHFSAADEAYILYRQNQFQLDIDMFGNLGNYSSNPPTPSATTTTTTTSLTPLFIDLGGVLAPVECLYYHIYSVKQHKGIPLEQTEEQESLVDLVQLGGPRNRKDFQLPGLCPIVQGRATYGRLQFRAATPNNARVHPDQPNPNQQYYRIVLSLVAKTATSLNFVFSKISPCLMVRGQNPGKFQGQGQGQTKPLSPPTEPKQEFSHPTYAQSQISLSLPSSYPQLQPSYDPTLARNSSPVSKPLPQPNLSQQNLNQQNMPQQNLNQQNLQQNQFNQLINQNSSQNLPQNMSNMSQNNMIMNLNQTQTNIQTQNQQNLNPFSQNPNPSHLPVLVSPNPPVLQPPPSTPTQQRGVKRPPSSQPLMSGGGGEGEGWTTDEQTGNVYRSGNVGINTRTPQEALTVHGNILVTGDLLKPSDERIKTNITPITTASQLETVERLRLYDYELKATMGPDGNPMHERGVLAQELQKVMPSAVRVLKNVTLSDGTVMPELLVVQDRALLFENIGATQELSRSVREQRSRLTALSETVSHHVHEMGQSTKKAVQAMGAMMGFMLTEKKINYENSCFFLSIFGLGPAWTMYILGFYLPILWFFGLFYIASAVSVKKTAGVVHFITLILYVIYIGIILAWKSIGLKDKLIALGAVEGLGILVTITFGIYWRRKQNERHLAMAQGIVQEYERDTAHLRASSVNLQSSSASSDSGNLRVNTTNLRAEHNYASVPVDSPSRADTPLRQLEKGERISLSKSQETPAADSRSNYRTFSEDQIRKPTNPLSSSTSNASRSPSSPRNDS